jgi:hypothetical protein
VKIAILDHNYPFAGKLADVPLAALLWNDPANPGMYSERPELNGTVADLGRNDHLMIYPSTKLLWTSYRGVRCHLTLLFEEPAAIHGKYFPSVLLLWWRFFRIFGNARQLIRLLPNARYLAPANATVKLVNAAVPAKPRRVSLIASEKRFLTGHALRHEIADWVTASGQDVDIMGRGYKPFDRREDGFEAYQFSVVIENSQQPGYFTEKLIDAFLCDAIPIYWGAPDISDFFDPRGMVICQTGEDIKVAISSLKAEDYQRLAAHSPENRRRAMKFANFKSNAIKLLQSELGKTPSRQ